MKTKKWIGVILICIVGIITGTGCKEKEESLALKFITPAGAPTYSVLKMMKDVPVINNNTISYESIESTDLLVTKLQSEEADFAIVPTNLAANLYNKGKDYRVIGGSSWGNLYIISTLPLSGWNDLQGKEIYSIGKGLTPDLIFRYLAGKNGFNVDEDFKITYMNGATELAPMFLSGKAPVALIPEPMKSTILSKNPETKEVLDLQKEWEKQSSLGSSYPQAVLVVKGAMVEDHKDTVAAVVQEFEKNIQWINENVQEAGAYAEEQNLGSKNVVAQAVPYSNIHFNPDKNTEDIVNEYLDILLTVSPESIGGKLPDEGFYYTPE